MHAFLFLVACGGSAAAPEHAKPPRPAPPLRSFLQPGAAWILEARPKELWSTPEVRRALAGSIVDADLVDYAGRTGVDLRQTEEAVAAGYGDGVVWIARGGHDPLDVTKRLRERLHPSEHDDARRGLAGLLQGRPVALRRLGKRAIAFGDDAQAPVEAIRREIGRASCRERVYVLV